MSSMAYSSAAGWLATWGDGAVSFAAGVALGFAPEAAASVVVWVAVTASAMLRAPFRGAGRLSLALDFFESPLPGWAGVAGTLDVDGLSAL